VDRGFIEPNERALACALAMFAVPLGTISVPSNW